MTSLNNRASTSSIVGSVQADDELRLARWPHPFLFLSTLFLPVLALPYIISKRQMRPVWKRMESIEKDIQRLRADLDRATSSMGTTTSHLRCLQITVDNTVKEAIMHETRTNNLETNIFTCDNALRELTLQYNDAKRSSDIQISTLRNVGMSLADVAAFMQEIERNLGLQTSKQNQDQRGIEKLRSLALRMQMLQRTPNNGDDHKASG